MNKMKEGKSKKNKGRKEGTNPLPSWSGGVSGSSVAREPTWLSSLAFFISTTFEKIIVIYYGFF